VPVAVEQKQKPDGDPPSQRIFQTTGTASQVTAIDPASMPPDIARILAAWEQLPADVRARLTARGGSATQLRLA
jgi:hypothetical protein